MDRRAGSDDEQAEIVRRTCAEAAAALQGATDRESAREAGKTDEEIDRIVGELNRHIGEGSR